jgi:hypothetical protein
MSSNGITEVFGQVYKNLIAEYKKNQNKKLLMVDAFIVYSFVSAIIQVDFSPFRDFFG